MMTAWRLTAIACVVGSLAAGAFGARAEAGLEFARKTLAFVERSASRPALARELKALEKRFADARAARKVDDNAFYAEAGALPTLYAATVPDLAGGSYIGPDGFGEQRGAPTIVDPRRKAKDASDADRLWQVSTDLTGVEYDFGASAL